jgi:3-phenylpropionate/trans-cinnamate dioxygenase ferredoxin component
MTDDFLAACPADELEDDKPRRFELDGVPVCLVRAQGDIYAINDVCSHADVSLSEGDVDETTIECWLHGSRFDLATGKPTGLPATQPVPVYPVKVDAGEIYVNIHNPHLER